MRTFPFDHQSGEASDAMRLVLLQELEVVGDSEAAWLENTTTEIWRPPRERIRLYLRGYAVAATVVVVWILAMWSGVSLYDSVPSFCFMLIAALALHLANHLAAQIARRRTDPFWVGQPQDGIDEWPVTLDVVQNGVVTGSDTGRLWIQRGVIYFTGKKTSFALAIGRSRDLRA